MLLSEYNYLQEPLENYIKKLSSKTPCPGGGSASILSLAIANALIIMVCNYTIESKKVDETSRQKAKEIIVKAEDIQKYLNNGIEQDSVIYQKIQETSKIARKNIEHQRFYQDALKQGIELHINMLNYCKMMLDWNEILAEKGNPYLISDVGVSTSLILGVIEATKINIFVNLKEISEKCYVSEVMEKVSKSYEVLLEISQKIISIIEKKLL